MAARLMRGRPNVFQENELNMKIERRKSTTLNMKAQRWDRLMFVPHFNWNEMESYRKRDSLTCTKENTQRQILLMESEATELKLNENEDEAYRTYRRVHTYLPFNVFFFF